MDERLPSSEVPSGDQPRPLSQTVGTPSHPPAPGPKMGKGIVIRALLGFFLLIVIIVLAWRSLPLVVPQTKENVTLTYWGLWEEESVMKGIFEDFKKEYPYISVAYTKQDPEQYRERLITRMNNGTGPDIFRYHNSWVPMMVLRLLPLSSEVISVGDFKKNYYPVASQDLIRNGALLGVPLQMDTLSLFINTDIFKAAGVTPPQTWDDFVRVSRQLTVKDESNRIRTAGASMGTYDNITHASDILSLLFVQNGANPRKLASNPDKAAEALDFYTAFAKSENVWDDTLDPSVLAFSKGNLAMYFGYSWDVFTITALNPSLQFEIQKVPSLPGRTTTIASYWVEGISAKSAHPKEAQLLLQYLSKKETLEKIYAEQAKTRQFGELYPRVDMADSLKDNRLAYPFLSQAAVAISTPFSSETHDTGLNAEANKHLSTAIRSALGNTSSQNAIQTLIQGQAEVSAKYGQ